MTHVPGLPVSWSSFHTQARGCTRIPQQQVARLGTQEHAALGRSVHRSTGPSTHSTSSLETRLGYTCTLHPFIFNSTRFEDRQAQCRAISKSKANTHGIGLAQDRIVYRYGHKVAAPLCQSTLRLVSSHTDRPATTCVVQRANKPWILAAMEAESSSVKDIQDKRSSSSDNEHDPRKGNPS